MVLDLTPLLGELRANNARSRDLIRDARLVLGLGNRAMLALLAGQAMPTARVLGAVTTARETIAAVARERPTMLLISDHLEEGEGIDTALALKASSPELRVLLLIHHKHRTHAIRRALQVDLDGVVLESSFGSGALRQALHSVSGGGIYIDPALRAEFRRGYDQGGPTEPLSQRELEVLTRVATGDSNAEIGKALFLSADTVKSHLTRVLGKLPARDRTHAAVLALRWGLIDWPDAEQRR